MKYLGLNPAKCIGCSTCSLVCSLHNLGEYNPDRAWVQVIRDDRQAGFRIAFSNQCRLCLNCARSCPEGAIFVVEAGGECR